MIAAPVLETLGPRCKIQGCDDSHNFASKKGYCIAHFIEHEYCERVNIPSPSPSDKEEWKDIIEFEGKYKISTFGRVMSYAYKSPRILKNRITKDGYCTVVLTNINGSKEFYIHYLVLKTFIGERPFKHHCCHSNGIPRDNRLINLRYDTVKRNKEDTKLLKLLNFTF